MNWLLNAKQVQNKTHSKLCCLLVLTSLFISPSEKKKKKRTSLYLRPIKPNHANKKIHINKFCTLSQCKEDYCPRP